MRRLFLCHDIGGAELLVAYKESRFPDEPALFIGDGPAAELFEKNGMQIARVSMGVQFSEVICELATKYGIEEAFCSTGTTAYEVTAMRAIMGQGVRTSALVEHWTNYRERFGYPEIDWVDNLPDRVIFFDDHAVEIARQLGFPEELILKEANPLTELRKKKFMSLEDSIGVLEIGLAVS